MAEGVTAVEVASGLEELACGARKLQFPPYPPRSTKLHTAAQRFTWVSSLSVPDLPYAPRRVRHSPQSQF